MAAERYECPLDPDTGSVLTLYLYKNVRNVEQVRRSVLDASWPCSIIKPSLILHPFQVAVAANKAAVAQHDASMITRSLFSEILFNLSLTKNISQSLTRFGIEKDENMLVAFVDAGGDADRHRSILSQIQGEPCPIADLNTLTDFNNIKKVYKLEKVECTTRDHLLDVVVSRMATKSFVSH